MPTVTVLVPCRNEIEKLPRTVEMIAAQTRRPDKVVIVDGLSEDGSREYLDQLRLDWADLVVIDNPRRTVPTALNLGLQAADTDYVARMDTHAVYEPTYLQSLVDFLEHNSTAAGAAGVMRTEGRTAWGRSIASTLRRPFGLGGSSHRIRDDLMVVPHAFTPCYRRSELLEVTGWDESLAANEDFELDHRLGLLGKQLWLVPGARSTWFVRDDVLALSRQMFRYGLYKATVLRLHPRSASPRQFAPPAVVGLLLVSMTGRKIPATAAVAYLAAAAALGASAARADGASPIMGMVVPPTVHISWGAGLLVGLARTLTRAH